jgi:hypothetical protein
MISVFSAGRVLVGVTLGVGTLTDCGARGTVRLEMKLAVIFGFVEFNFGTLNVVLRLPPIDHHEKML